MRSRLFLLLAGFVVGVVCGGPTEKLLELGSDSMCLPAKSWPGDRELFGMRIRVLSECHTKVREQNRLLEEQLEGRGSIFIEKQ